MVMVWHLSKPQPNIRTNAQLNYNAECTTACPPIANPMLSAVEFSLPNEPL